MTDNEGKKITVLIPDDLHTDVGKYIPWGLRRHLVISLLRLAVDASKRDGNIALGAIMDNRYRLVPIMSDEHIASERSNAPS